MRTHLSLPTICILSILALGEGCSSREGYVQNDYAPVAVSDDLADIRRVSSPVPTAPMEPPDEQLIDQESSTVDIQLVSQPVPMSEDETAPQIAPLPRNTGVTIEELERIALDNNPAIRQLSAIAYRAAGVRDQVGAYPNPTIGYSAQQIADAGTDQHSVYVDQEIVMGDKLWLNEQVLNAATRAQLQELAVQRFRVATDVRIRFYEALGAQRRVELAREFETVAARGVDVAIQRRAALEGSQAEILQAEILLNQVELIRQQAEVALSASWSDLAAIAGVPHWTNPGLVGELETGTENQDWETRYAMLLSASPELSAARSRVSAARANLERQEAQPIPNLLVNLGAGVDNGTDQGMLNLQVGAPIPVFNANEGNIRAAYGDYCSATHDVRRIEMSLRSRLARTSQEYDSALAAVRKYENEILSRAQQSLDLTEQAYAAGEVNFLQVLVIQRTAFDTNLSYIENLTELARARANVDGLLLTGGLDQPAEFGWSDELRGQTFSGQ